MHKRLIVHRDLKPDNILIDEDFNLKLTDFGDSKKITFQDAYGEPTPEEAVEILDDRNTLFDDLDNQRGGPRKSFVGTALYISPEMLTDNLSSPAMDMWALGCMIYQMRVGLTPFHGQFEHEVFQKITEGKPNFPFGMEQDT